MDNSNQFTFNLQGIMAHASELIKAMETGKGLNIPPDKIEEFQKQMKEKGGLDKVNEIKKQMENLKNTIRQANGTTN